MRMNCRVRAYAAAALRVRFVTDLVLNLELPVCMLVD